MSGTSGESFERQFPNRLEDLSRVIEEAVGFVQGRGVGEQAVYLTNLAIEEMATNILKYGYDDDARHEILLRIEARADGLWLTLEDDGHEFNPLAAPEPDVTMSAEDRLPGGLGIHLVRRMAPDMSYERRDGWNRLTVRIPT